MIEESVQKQLLLRTALDTGVVVIKFIKADGTERVMRCKLTIHPTDLGLEERLNALETACPLVKAGGHKLKPWSVYDVEAQGYRKFHLSRLMEAQLVTIDNEEVVGLEELYVREYKDFDLHRDINLFHELSNALY